MDRAHSNDPGLLGPADLALLVDLYELTMSASYLARGLTDEAIFELFPRRLPPRRDWLLAAGLGPTLELLRELRYGEREIAYLRSLDMFDEEFLDYLAGFRFTGDVEAIPEGTAAFANEPLLRVTAPLIEAQLVETLLLNQINFQTMIATKAARIVLAAGGGGPGAGGGAVGFSPRGGPRAAPGRGAGRRRVRRRFLAAARPRRRRGDEGRAIGGRRGVRRHVERGRGDALRPAARGDDGALLHPRLRHRGGGVPVLHRELPGGNRDAGRHLRQPPRRAQRHRRGAGRGRDAGGHPAGFRRSAGALPRCADAAGRGRDERGADRRERRPERGPDRRAGGIGGPD